MGERKEYSQQILTAYVGLLAISALTFTRAQKRWILERDKNTNQHPVYQDESDELEIHHIRGQAYLKRRGYRRDQIDHPYNAITLSKQAHDLIHPEPHEMARLAKQGEKYWNDEHDGELRRIATENTKRFIRETGKSFPARKRK